MPDTLPAAHGIAPPAPAVLRVQDSGTFPIGRLLCIGRNHAGHTRGMRGNRPRELPFEFCKPANAALLGTTIS